MGVTMMGTDVNGLISKYQPRLGGIVDNLIDSGRIRLTAVYDREELLSIANTCLWELIVEGDNFNKLSSKISKRILLHIAESNPNALCLLDNEYETTCLRDAFGVIDSGKTNTMTGLYTTLINEVFPILTAKERTVIILRYGLDGGGYRTYESVASMTGRSTTRMRQVHDDACRKIRHGIYKGRLKGMSVYISTNDIYDESSDDLYDNMKKLIDYGQNHKTVICKTITKVTTVIEKIEERIEITTE